MSNQSGNARAYTEVDVVKNKIDEANTIDLINVFKSYHINIDNTNRKIVCPFPFHKGGRENSASFWFYPETNSFFCFGCKTGGSSVDFIAKMEDLHRYEAAVMLLGDFRPGDIDLTERDDNQNKYHLDFSHTIREFIFQYQGDEKAVAYAEYVAKAFDNMLAKYHLEEQGIQLLVSKLKKTLLKYE